MPDRLGSISDAGLDEAILKLVIDEHAAATLPRLERLWAYYRNPSEPAGMGHSADPFAHGAYALGQERGLPPRITGRGPRDAGLDDRAAERREVVVENDIAWRIHTMVDFMFGKPVLITSTARDERTRRLVELALDALWEGSGGISLLQDAALLGHVYGHVDLVLRTEGLEPGGSSVGGDGARGDAEQGILRAARQLTIEPVDPTRGIPVLDPADYRRVAAYIIHVERELNEARPVRAIDRILGAVGRRPGPRRRTASWTEVLTPGLRRYYEDERPAGEAPERWLAGAIPVVHIQNIAQPFRYEGLGEVEPLVPLQDELNTRLSDRASRVTFQAFKMYIAKGLEGFDRVGVSPGQIFCTDNTEASVQAFGGDADSPSERDHILEVREALDKVSAVPPLASGVVRAKIGNLSSANALRITLMGLLAKNARKRVTYGRGIEAVCRLALEALDRAGVLRTRGADRGVRLHWPDPLPVDLHEQVLAAKAKTELGVDRARVLADLGESPADPGIT